MPEIDEVTAAGIRSAFAARQRPARATNSVELSVGELASLDAVFALDWREADASTWELHSEAASYLSPEAFCYYLPGMLLAAMEQRSSNISVATAIVAALDRSPRRDWWDEQFAARWTLLVSEELAAVEGWIVWLTLTSNSGHDDVSLERAMDTLDLLNEAKRLSP